MCSLGPNNIPALVQIMVCRRRGDRPLSEAMLDSLLGAVSIRKTVLPGVAIPMLKIRRPNGRLIFNIGIAIPR